MTPLQYNYIFAITRVGAAFTRAAGCATVAKNPLYIFKGLGREQPIPPRFVIYKFQ